MTAKDALRSAMEAGSLRPEDVAAKAGVSIGTVYNVLSGQRQASRLVILALKQIPTFAERYDGSAVA